MLSDVVASGATAHSAQALVSLPFADQRIVKRDLQQLMAGVVDALNEDGCSLIGGHTAESTTLSLGFVVNGFRQPHDFSNQQAVNEGDHLVLTKPIGSGVMLAGLMQAMASGVDVQQVVACMQQSNRVAASVLYQCGAKAVTDVTGFGLLGHLHRLLAATDAGATIQVRDVPVFDGAIALAERAVRSTLLEQNQRVLEHVTWEGVDNDLIALSKTTAPYNSDEVLQQVSWLNLLCDPQTSGGLLGIVPASQSKNSLKKLHDSGYEVASVVGTVVNQSGIHLRAADRPV